LNAGGRALLTVLATAAAGAGRAPEAGGDDFPGGAATLVYGERDSARCFSEAFLELVARDAAADVPDRLTPVDLRDGERLFRHFFALFSGEGFFRLTAEERGTLRRYLLEGGFVLASAGCSSAAWDVSFREEMRAILPDHPLEPLAQDHPLFSLLYQTAPLRLEDGSPAHLEAVTAEGRIILVYSPAGLNDTASLQDCCCCTGNEVEGGAFLNANILLFSLVQIPG
jgi:hypothetical protein